MVVYPLIKIPILNSSVIINDPSPKLNEKEETRLQLQMFNLKLFLEIKLVFV